VNDVAKVAIIGTGKEAQQHFSLWSQIEDAVVDEVLATASSQDTWPETLTAKRLENASEIEAEIVDVCVPTTEKAAWIEQVAKAGAHIICETPLAATANEAAAIAKVCAEKQAHLYTRTSKQYAPAYTNAQASVANGKIGKHGVARISQTKLHPGHAKGDIFMSLGAPVFAWLTETFGDVERVMAKHVQEVRQDGSPVEYGLVSIRMADQSFAHVELSWANGVEKDSFELTGDQGMLTYDSGASNPVEVSLSNGKHTQPGAVMTKTALHRKLEAITAIVKTGTDRDPAVNNSVVQPEQMAEAALQSAQTGQPVQLKGVR
jgi:predicted dehydrogenase